MIDLSRDRNLFALLTDSYTRRVGASLVPAGIDADWLYFEATFAVLAHDASADPRFIYANRAAQARFGYDADEILGLPSRLSAEIPNRAERQALLDDVARYGFSRNYRGLRVAKGGRRFWIEEAVVWQLDQESLIIGQAAAFSKWHEV